VQVGALAQWVMAVQAVHTRSLVAAQAALWYWPDGQPTEHGAQLSAAPSTR
jgi:hypothetical protein